MTRQELLDEITRLKGYVGSLESSLKIEGAMAAALYRNEVKTLAKFVRYERKRARNWAMKAKAYEAAIAMVSYARAVGILKDKEYDRYESRIESW